MARIGWSSVCSSSRRLWLMRAGWQRRGTRAGRPARAARRARRARREPCAPSVGATTSRTTARATGSTAIVVHGLGVRSRGELDRHRRRACAIDRAGRRDFFIPAAALRGGQARPGHRRQGRRAEGGLLVITWRRTATRADRHRFRSDARRRARALRRRRQRLIDHRAQDAHQHDHGSDGGPREQRPRRPRPRGRPRLHAAAPTAPRATTFGEAVFTTGMTGYQETLTDPSYPGQVVRA